MGWYSNEMIQATGYTNNQITRADTERRWSKREQEHTLSLHALPSMRRGWSCTQRPCPWYIPKSRSSRTRELTHKSPWRWWLARGGLMTPTSKIQCTPSEQAQGSQNGPRSILSLVNSGTILPRWRQEIKKKKLWIDQPASVWLARSLSIVVAKAYAVGKVLHLAAYLYLKYAYLQL